MPPPSSQAQRQRRWAPKVRTGCKTCKIRHRRCDEGKPHCMRCLKDKFRCDGYEPPKTWLFEPSRKVEPEPTVPNSRPLQSLSPDRGPLTSPITASNRNQTLSDFSRLLLEPSSPWRADVDQSYTQLFLLKTAPLLSSTRKWHHFWQSIVPQAAWQNPSVHHAMVAVAATFDSYVSGTDHTTVILERRAQAVRAFSDQPPSWDIALIVCRLFSSMAQCNEDFPAAMAHMKSGEKILREATQHGHTRSEIVRLMAATFMGLSADANNDLNVIKRFPLGKRQAFLELKVIGSDYARLLRRIAQMHHRDLDTPTMGFLSVAFTTMNQAISSAMYPDILVFTGDDGVVSAAEVRSHLTREDSLLTLDDLIIMYPCLLYELEQYVEARAAGRVGPEVSSLEGLKQRLKVLVDNYVVQVSEIEPRMTAGTFWLDDEAIPGCLMDKHLDRPQIGVSPCFGREDAAGHDDPVVRERRQYYHEYVCQYRSGFMG
ncbi:Fungal Zn2-Cys6 binuclear cluster domain-containing protein [Cladophialophora immunda]|nr:Fungal Zn2-Cys6 binuclear cluster domain-containing protein [Cladophialophora immunda]